MKINMEKNRRFAKERIVYINAIKIFLLVYFSIYVIQCLIYPEEKVGGNGLLLLVGTLFSVFCGQRADKLYKFFLGQLPVIVYCLIIGRNTWEKILFFVFSVLLILVVLGSRREGTKCWYVPNLGLGWLALLIPGIYIRGFFHINRADIVLLRICLVYFWLHYINMFFSNQLKYVGKLEQTSKCIKKEFYKAGNKILFFFSFVSMGTLVAGSCILIEGLEGKIGKVLHRFFRWLLHFLVDMGKDGHGDEIEEESDIVEDGKIEEVTIVTNDWLKELVEIIQQIVMNLFKVITVITVFGVIIFCCYMIWKSFYGKRAGIEIEELQEVKEKLEKKNKQEKRQRRKFHFFRNNNEKVRHLFYKEIVRNKKESYVFQKGNTAWELKKAVNENKEELVEGLLPYYNKARYSGEEISSNEWEQCKKVFRK